MKQGSGSSRMADGKREPISHRINVGGVSEIGAVVVKNPDPLYDGRGYTAPAPVVNETLPSGSQGKYK